MKRFFGCLFLLFSLLLPLFAQDVNEQYETFSWQPVAKAKQYGVIIEKFNQSSQVWEDYKSVKTKDTALEVLFTPGIYRVAICTYNLIGRRGSTSEWVSFKILEEHIPYLNEKFLPKNKTWNAPVLYLKRNPDSPAPDSSELFITAPENFASNTILVKGKNIFSPRTEFYLVPKDNPSGDEVPYTNYCDKRNEQKLKIIQRNTKEYSVVVSYESEKLQSGYYALEVRNPGDNSDSIDILVLDDTAAFISIDKGFYQDERYNVNCLDLQGFSNPEFSITGTGLNSSQEFYLEPAYGVYAYPFQTEVYRPSVKLELLDAVRLDDGKARLSFTCDIQNVYTGYYNVTVHSKDNTVSKANCLVKKPFASGYSDSIKKIKTKYNKRSNYVDVTIKGNNLDPSKKYTLVSQYVPEIDSNSKVSVPLTVSGNKLTGQLSPEQISNAKYALMIEDSASSSVVYCSFDKTLKLSVNRMTESAVAETFLRPIGTGKNIAQDADDIGSIQFFDNKIKLVKTPPALFTNLKVDFSLLADNSTVIDLELDLLNFKFIALSAGYEYTLKNNDMLHNLFTTLKLAIPNDYFMPYIGAGVGFYTDFSNFTSSFAKENIYAIGQLGVNLFTILDVRYNLFLENAFTTPYFRESLSFGFAFPLRAYKFKRNVLTRQAVITKPGTLEGPAMLDPSLDVDKLEIQDSKVVSGFAGYKKLEYVSLGISVEVIAENAFSDCEQLNTVNFAERYNDNDSSSLIIKNGAFARDNQIDSIKLPYRTSVVESGAFAGWTSGQIILLSWLSDDKTERDLSGLVNCSATVLYADNEVFTGTYATPLEDQRNWVGLNQLEVENVSIYKDGKYILGVKLEGVGLPRYRTELDTWINQNTPEQALNFLKSGEKIKFEVQGDGNKYDFIITTQDGGYFYYRFKTVEGMVSTIEIPYKKMSKYSYSSQKKLDMEKIKMFCIMPMCKNEYNDAAFFGFEVTDNEK